jgi:6-pyruvoyltetrahydropterin/6-carboxytetrahydropterin synthase
MPKITAERFHDFSAGHRVVGHEGKCRHLHGHNYRVHFICEAETNELDSVGRVIDFGEIKSRLCMWLEDNWDHKFLAWENDSLVLGLANLGTNHMLNTDQQMLNESFVFVPFNPTAENMASHLLEVVGPAQLMGTGVSLIRVKIEETYKCSSTVEFSND